MVSFHWLPVKYRIQFKALLFVYKGLHSLALPYISDLLSFHQTVHPNTSNSLQLIVPWTHLNLKLDRTFSVTAPQLWKNQHDEFNSLLKT